VRKDKDLKQKDTNAKGRLLVFEGGHGSGKTMQAKMLVKYLQSNRTRARYTKEPYGKDLISLINKYSNDDLLDSPVLMYLLAASRYIHVKDIESWIANGEFVVCDRYVLSSFVYQQIQGIPLDAIKKVNSFAIKPHATFYVCVPLEERLKRLCRTHRNRKSFFLENDKLTKEQDLYDNLIHNWDEKLYGRVVVINGEASPIKVHENIVNYLIAEMKQPS
jgi:dTMP kinase